RLLRRCYHRSNGPTGLDRWLRRRGRCRISVRLVDLSLEIVELRLKRGFLFVRLGFAELALGVFLVGVERVQLILQLIHFINLSFDEDAAADETSDQNERCSE